MTYLFSMPETVHDCLVDQAKSRRMSYSEYVRWLVGNDGKTPRSCWMREKNGMIYCGHCNEQAAAPSGYCPHCGARMNGE